MRGTRETKMTNLQISNDNNGRTNRIGVILSSLVAFTVTLVTSVEIDRSARWNLSSAQPAYADIHVTKARIGCLDIQKSGNLTAVVRRACNGKTSCSYKAPSERQYRRMGIRAKTRTFCTQGMEIKYHCGDRRGKRAFVPGDAWKHGPARMTCPRKPRRSSPISNPRGISVKMARIGCLDIQRSGNLTTVVGRACNGKTSCSYKAPSERQYRRMGIRAKTRTFCTQGMEIKYHCADGSNKRAFVRGDAWRHGPAQLNCRPKPRAKGKSIRITSARIGCLDIQKSGNLTDVVARACTGKRHCDFQAPSESQYEAMGVRARRRSFCTQGMEIKYHCGDRKNRRAFVPGDAWKHPPAELVCADRCEGLFVSNAKTQPRPQGASRLSGWADLHVHPMSHLGFGGKALHGAPDRGITMPASTMGCNIDHDKIAKNMRQALPNCNGTHGGWGTNNTCGDYIRAMIINKAIDTEFKRGMRDVSNVHGDHRHSGYPDLKYWPHHSTKLHQQMWWEWVKRAYQGGLRVMVALTVNSETLAQMLNGNTPYDDKSTADKQICAMKRFVDQHSDFMQIAYSARDARRIVDSNKIAVILGMEVDRIGNFTIRESRPTIVKKEIKRLHRSGIRYVFPIHLIDNAFGGSAVYETLFNLANRNINGRFYRVVHSKDPYITFNASLFKDVPHSDNFLIWGVRPLLGALGNLPAPGCMNHISCLPVGKLQCCKRFSRLVRLLEPSGQLDVYRTIEPGHANAKRAHHGW